MSNTVVDLESAPIPASAIPTNTVTAKQKADEKEVLVFDGERDVQIGGAEDIYHSDDVEPTDEEYRALKK